MESYEGYYKLLPGTEAIIEVLEKCSTENHYCVGCKHFLCCRDIWDKKFTSEDFYRQESRIKTGKLHIRQLLLNVRDK